MLFKHCPLLTGITTYQFLTGFNQHRNEATFCKCTSRGNFKVFVAHPFHTQLPRAVTGHQDDFI